MLHTEVRTAAPNFDGGCTGCQKEPACVIEYGRPHGNVMSQIRLCKECLTILAATIQAAANMSKGRRKGR